MCIWTKQERRTLAYNTDIFSFSSSFLFMFFFFFKENDTAELGGKAWVWCMVFEILMPRQKANTSHSLIIKYSHYSFFFFLTVSFLTKRDVQAFHGFLTGQAS